MESDAIGGYFELELSDRGHFSHDDGYCVNSGRNALELILRHIRDISRLWIPYYTCDVILEPVTKLGIQYSFYHVNQDLELSNELDLQTGEYILLTNYFGIKDRYVSDMASKYGERLIVDNSQAYFSEPLEGIKTFYSPRKFVGVPDGGIAIIPGTEIDMSAYEQDYSYDRCSHLLKRIDIGATEGYADFKQNSLVLKNQPIRRMSRLTRAILRSVNFESVKETRLSNLHFLHENLRDRNLLRCVNEAMNSTCPMVYPYIHSCIDFPIRQQLIQNKIFVAAYWPNVHDWCSRDDIEHKLTRDVIPLPIDQRYGEEEIKRMLVIIQKKEYA